MKRRLQTIFGLVLLTAIATMTWASAALPFWQTPHALLTHPWYIATLVDTYLAFFTYWLWVAYKEASILRAALWLLLIFALGNIAMAAYALLTLLRLPPGATLEDFLLRRRERG